MRAAASARWQCRTGRSVVVFDGDETSFQLLQQRMHVLTPERIRRSAPVVYCLFDVLYVDDSDVTDLTLLDRKPLVQSLFEFGDPLRFVDHRSGDGVGFAREACAAGWEGLIAKDGRSSYVHGRSRAWLKFKCSTGQELVVGGYTDPRRSRVGFGALLLGYFEDGELQYAGRVGTGFNDATLHALSLRLRALASCECPFADAASVWHDAGGTTIHRVEPEVVAEIRFSEWTADGRLRHPRYAGLRDDKPARQVVRERPE